MWGLYIHTRLVEAFISFLKEGWKESDWNDDGGGAVDEKNPSESLSSPQIPFKEWRREMKMVEERRHALSLGSKMIFVCVCTW
jgi:hypothetical protein